MRFEDPVELFHEAQAALLARDAERFGACFDPTSLAQLRRQVLDSFRATHPPLTVEAILQQMPDMPREAAEYQVALADRQRHPLTRLREFFPAAASVEDVERLSPADFFFAHTEARSLGNQIRRLIAEGHLPAAADQIPEREQVALGWVQDGDDVAHVLYRDQFDEDDPSMWKWLAELPEGEREWVRKMAGRSHPHTVACVRQPDGGWKLLAEYGTFGQGGISAVGYTKLESEEHG